MIKIMVVFVLCNILNIGYTKEYSDELFVNKITKTQLLFSPKWSVLSEQNNAKKRIVHQIKIHFPSTLLNNITITRLHLSNLFSVKINNKKYITDDYGRYWLLSNNMFYFSETGVESVDLSGVNTKEYLDLIFFIQTIKQRLVYFEGDVDKQTLYIFIDLSCIYCKNLYLKKINKLKTKGYPIVLIPFLKDINNSKVKSVTFDVFCKKNMIDRISGLDNVYVDGVKKYYTENVSSTFGCNNMIQKSLISFFNKLGDNYKIKGSPFIITSSGTIYYGLSFLNKLLIQKD